MPRRRWSTAVRRRVWERFNGRCQMCQQPTDERGFDLDHHIPLALGGEDEEANLRPLCRPCHRVKTGGEDVPRIAKAKRQEAAYRGFKQPKGSIPRPPRAPRSTTKTDQLRALRERAFEETDR
jgi:5-methylcytosine-specific restriction endonuclease McrA